MDGQLTDEVAHFEYEGTGASKGVTEYAQKAVRPYRFENVKTTGTRGLAKHSKFYYIKDVPTDGYFAVDESLARPGRVNTKLGTIMVSLFLVSRWDEYKARSKQTRIDPRSIVNPGYIHEKDNREGRHTVWYVTE